MKTAKEVMGELNEEEFMINCTNFKFFAEQVLGYSIQPFQLEWVEMVQKYRRIAIEAPTGFGKTTILGDAFCLWTAFLQKNKQMCIVSKSLPQSTKILNKIKETIEDNEILRELIPKNKPLSNWCSATFMELSTGCKIFCRPYSQNIKGIHVDYLLGDEVASYNDYDIWYRFVVTRTNAKNGTVVAISTPDNIADLMQELIHNPEYVGKIYPAIQNGKSIWPSRFPLTKLEKIKSEIGLSAWEREYMCNPQAEAESAIYPPHLLIDCFDYSAKFIQSPREGFTTIGCDFAIAAGPRADYDAYIVLNKIGNKAIILYGETHKGLSIAAKVMRLEDLYKMFRKQTDNKDTSVSTIKFIIDPSNVGQAIYEQLRFKGIPVETANFDAFSRNAMLINLRQMIENKELVIPRNSEDSLTMTFTDKLTKELISMREVRGKINISYESKAPHDDTVMALAMACSGISKQKEFKDMMAF